MKKLLVLTLVASIMPMLAFAQPPAPACVLQGAPGVSPDALQQVTATAQANLKAN